MINIQCLQISFSANKNAESEHNETISKLEHNWQLFEIWIRHIWTFVIITNQLYPKSLT